MSEENKSVKDIINEFEKTNNLMKELKFNSKFIMIILISGLSAMGLGFIIGLIIMVIK